MNNYAKRNCKAVVITNPVNTMMYILQKYATDFPKENFSSLNRLDENRAFAQVAKKAGCRVSDVKNIFVWGNHNKTMFPDLYHGTIKG